MAEFLARVEVPNRLDEAAEPIIKCDDGADLLSRLS